MVVLTIRISTDLHELLRNKSFKERISINKIINEILEKELEK